MSVRLWVRHLASIVASILALAVGGSADPPTAWADEEAEEESVTYEVVSDTVAVAHIQYQTAAGRMHTGPVALPWRTDAVLRSALGPPPDGSQVRADWRSTAAPTRWVTVRIIHQGKVVCQNTLDIGNATCYGVTQRIT